MDYFPSMKHVKLDKKKVCSDVQMLLDVCGVFGFNSLYTFCDDIKCYIFIKYDF